MKKILSMIMAVVMLLCLVPVQLMAEDANEAVVLDNGGADGLELGDEVVPEGVGEGAIIDVTFVKKDNSEVKVSFADKDAKLGLNGTPGQTGSWFSKSYFIGWSNNEDYIKNGEGFLLYETATVDDLLKASNNAKEITLHALYASASLSYIVKDSKVMINDEVAGKDFVNFAEKDVKKVKNETTANIKESDLNNDAVKYEIKTINSEFTMNKFAQAAVYKNPWVGALENGSTWSDLSKKSGFDRANKKAYYGKVTVVDLHVHVDERLILPDEFELAFTSYTFRPYSVFSEINSDGTVVKPGEVYPYLGFPGVAGEKYGVLESIKDNEPKTTFKVKSYLTNDTGEKVPVHDFVIRTRMRISYDNYGKRIEPASMEQIQSNMKLELASGTFEVPKKEAIKIAKGEAKPITIKGYINGTVKGIPLQGYGEADDKIKSEDEVLTFKLVDDEPAPTPKPSEPSTVILTLDENYRNGKITNIEVEEGDLIEPHLYIPRRRGYIFRGWSYDQKHLDEVKPGDRIYTDTTLYAIWKRAEEEKVEEPEEIKGEDHKAYIFGYPDGSVRPNGSITRAEAAAMLARLLNIEAIGSAAKPQFIDTESSWYNKAINTVVFRGIMKGYPDGRFRPNAPITRAEFTQMISTIDNKPYGVAPFADVPGHWAERAIGSEYQAKRITGYPDGLFRPDANITRAEAAVILNKIFERKYDNLSLLKCKNPQMIKRFTDLDETFWGWNDMVEATNTHEYVRREKNRVPEDWLLIK